MTDHPRLEVPFDEVEKWEKIEGSCARLYAAAEWGYKQALATPPPASPTSQITFNAPSPPEEVIRLDNDGFHYKGQFVADAGEAHRLMMAFLEQNTKSRPEPLTDEAILALAEEYEVCYIRPDGAVLYPFQDGTNMRDSLLSFTRAAFERWGHG